MRHNFFAFVAFSFLLNLTALVVHAEITVEYLGPLSAPYTLDAVPQGDFILGNTGNPTHIIQDWEIYSAYTRCSILNPASNGCICSSGYTINSYHLVVAKTGSEQVVSHLWMALGHSFKLDLFPPGTECYYPPGQSVVGYQAPYCYNIEEEFTVADEGFYMLSVTVPDCGCIFLDYTQIMQIPLLHSEPWGGDLFLVTDDNAAHCPDYSANPSMGCLWYNEIDAPGGLVMWADASCCENPVSINGASWDGVKALYR